MGGGIVHRGEERVGGGIAHRGEERVGGGEEVLVTAVIAVTVIGVGVGVEGGMGGAGDKEGVSGGNVGSFAAAVASLREVFCYAASRLASGVAEV